MMPKILIVRNDAKLADNCVYVTTAQMQELLCEFAADRSCHRVWFGML